MFGSLSHHRVRRNGLLTRFVNINQIIARAGVESLTVAFQSADKRIAWEKCFNDGKEALGKLFDPVWAD